MHMRTEIGIDFFSCFCSRCSARLKFMKHSRRQSREKSHKLLDGDENGLK